MGTPKTIGSPEIQAAITRLVTAISEKHRGTPALLLLGVANGGIELTVRLARQLGNQNPRQAIHAGTIDISFHRDDIGSHPIPKEIAPTHIPIDVHGASIILVDDVLFSGRTVKAALDELFDHGRPATVELAVLIDRGGRRLPVAATYAGLTVTAHPDEKVVVKLDPTNFKKDMVRIEPIPVVASRKVS